MEWADYDLDLDGPSSNVLKKRIFQLTETKDRIESADEIRAHARVIFFQNFFERPICSWFLGAPTTESDEDPLLKYS
jgi:hypothetical protein